MKLLLNILILFVIFCNAKGLIKMPPNETITAVTIFGDSIVDTGNNNYIATIAKCNFPPYGKDFPGQIPTGRFGNGKVPPDLIAEEFGVKDLVPPYLDPHLQPQDLITGVCFASGGAGYDPLTSSTAPALSLSDQIELFKEYISKLKGIVGEERANFIVAKSLFLVVAGSNDISNTYFLAGARRLQYDVASYTEFMANNAAKFLNEIYGIGARRIGVFSAPPIGCVPSQRTIAGGIQRECVEKYNDAAKLFNAKLFSQIDSLNTNLPNSRIVYLDVYNPLLDLIQNPTKYGFDVANKGCCGTGKIEGVIKLPPNETIPAVIAFGDSIVDTGNNNNRDTFGKCNFLPYGKDFQGGIPTGRFSNGKVPPDIIAEELGIKGLVPPYLDPHLQPQDLLTGVCFASGGAGYDPLTSEIASALSLSDQIEMLKEYVSKLRGIVGEERANFIVTKSLFLVVGGSNDISNTYFLARVRQLQYDVASYTDLMANNAANFLKEIYGLGARRIGVLSAPPIGCVPSQRTLAGGILRECAEVYNEAAKMFNFKLSSKIDFLNTNLPNSKIVYLDAYNLLLDLIQNPKKYGFELVNKGCCGTGNIEVLILCNPLSPTCLDVSEYVFWDSFHPTEAAYRILITQILQKYINNFF